MEYKRLGKTDLLVSRIGFGGLAIGGFHYGKTKDKESIAAIRMAIRLGVNFFDTADIYGFGKSEKILAKGLGRKREKVIIATKVGIRWNKKKKESYYDLSSDYIFEAIEKSLSNLKIKKIPLYQIHYPDSVKSASETMEALNKLRRIEKIKYIGCSNFSPNDIARYQKYGRIESIQIPYNIIDQKAEENIFSVCRKWKMGIITFSPIAQGFLSGKYNEKIKFSKNDRRNKSKYFTPKVFKRIKPLLEKIKEIGLRHRKTMIQVALRWILDNPNVTCIIIGVKTPKEIKEATGAFGWRLSKKEREELTVMGKEVMS